MFLLRQPVDGGGGGFETVNMTTIIKGSVYTPKVSSLLYNRPSLLKNVSLQIPSRLLLQQHPVGPLRFTSSVIPIPDINQHVATRASFQCRYAKHNTTAHTKTVNYSRLWNRAPKWLTHSFIWIFFFWSIWMLPKWVFVVSSSFLLTVTLLRVSKKMEPDNVSFDDLVGVERPKDLFQRFLHVYQGKLLFRNCEVKLISPVLLYGPPGTGKTTLVHALAREAKVPFFSVSAHDIARAEAGINEINFLFIEARAFSRSIVYIKDVDAIARHQRTLLELCHEMDKCNKDGRVLVIVSTNRPETLDPDVMRSFCLKMHVGKPNADSKRTVIGLHLNKFLREEDKEAICNLVASQTPGFVWADLKKIANISMRLAAARGDNHVTMDVVLQALGMVKPYICYDENEATVQDQMQQIV